jgi:transketolase
MRNAFIDELVMLARKHEHIALVVGDLGYSVVEPFANEFPDRFINAGVAEQNMTGLAAGMASEGYHVFTYSIANFPTFRCAEQIRNDVDYHKLAVTVVAVGGGLAYGPLGYSHHAVQDYALMRSMPNMLIAAPGDPMEVRACLRYLVNNPQPSYLRLGKAGEPCFHQVVPEVSPGVWLPVKTSSFITDECHLTTGATLEIAMNESVKLNTQAVDVYSMPLWGMASKKAQSAQVSKRVRVVTFEDHLIDGGFGSWLLEAMHQGQNLREKISIQSLDSIVCGSVGKQSTLNSLGGLHRVDHIENLN